MSLNQLTLRDFRCFKKITWEPQPGLNFIVGPNAQGKSSILEAACMLLRMKSPRTNTLSELVHFGASSLCVEGMHDDGTHQKLVFSLENRFLSKLASGDEVPGGAGAQRRSVHEVLDGASTDTTPQLTAEVELRKKSILPRYQLFLDDVPQRAKSTYLAKGRVVWFGSNDLEIIMGPGERRRRFLDSAGLQIGKEYGTLLRFYERALRSRNLLLREHRSRREIEAYTAPLAESGDQLVALRRKLVEKLTPAISAACRAISNEELVVTYAPSTTLPLFEALATSRQQEERFGCTQVGPHRDELSLLLNGRSVSSFASEGQRRTIVLALKLGLADFLTQEENDQKKPPLLLLDDIFGELDLMRRNALIKGLPRGAQAFFTTTALEKIELPKKAALFHLNSEFWGQASNLDTQ